MAKYKVIVSNHVAGHLLEYVEFISNVSIEAAQQFISEVYIDSVVDCRQDNN